MITFLVSMLILVLGYFLYGRFVEKLFGIDSKRVTPAYRLEDGVDYVPLGWKKIFLIQFLNIAGLGPIFGAVAGAMWGPVAFLWIVFGCIFGGAVHDFFSGMISVRHDGLSIPEIIGKYLGTVVKQIMRYFTVALMILVGAVFVIGPAKILDHLTHESLEFMNITFWAITIFIYYILATLLPIDKLIGRIYPIFGLSLLFMALGIMGGLFYYNAPIPELTLETFKNMHNQGGNMPIFPMMFVSIACGAISGFHATQSPLMARCIKNETMGRKVFYGAMVAEGIVALIWAAAAMSFFGGVEQLNTNMLEHNGNAAFVVTLISETWLGKIGSIFAILGVVAAPITSGDTALRSARLIVADFLNINQKSMAKRLIVSIPIFLICFLLLQLKFDIIWRYMAWSNQTLATVVLWAITFYLFSEKKNYFITLLPAMFMTFVCSTYILIAPEGFRLHSNMAYIISSIISIGIYAIAFVSFNKKSKIP